MYQITILFQPPTDNPVPLDGRHITGRGLHGLLFKALKQADPTETDWLHEHPAPKPFSMAALYDGERLAGLRIGTVSPRVARLVVRAWEWHRRGGRPLAIGHQTFRVGEVTCVDGPDWSDLANARPVVRIDMEFLSPTTFRQGPGYLTLPVPYNVFYWPWRVWEAYAPPATLPDGWLDWCRDELFVTDHRLETAPVRIAGESELKGLVGWARFEALRGTQEQLSLLHALARLAAYTGVGYKTTMGLGAVVAAAAA